MSISTGPLYETLYVVAADLREDFENWLREFRQRSLNETGIEDARGYEADQENDFAGDLIRWCGVSTTTRKYKHP